MQNEEQTPAPDTGWQFHADETASDVQAVDSQLPTPVKEDVISWNASEFVARHKGTGWYSIAVIVTVILAAAVYFFTGKSIFSAVMIVIGGGVFIAVAARPPGILNYEVDGKGVHIGKKFYSYGGFKSFSIIDEGAFHSISLLPLERFMPQLTVYYEPSDEDRIVEVLSAKLPYEERKQGIIDQLMHRIGF